MNKYTQWLVSLLVEDISGPPRLQMIYFRLLFSKQLLTVIT